MSIKPDAWIKRMAESEGMIEPFSATRFELMIRVKNLFHTGSLVLGMTFAAPMSLKSLQIFTQQPLTPRFLMIIVLLISLLMFV